MDNQQNTAQTSNQLHSEVWYFLGNPRTTFALRFSKGKYYHANLSYDGISITLQTDDGNIVFQAPLDTVRFSFTGSFWYSFFEVNKSVFTVSFMNPKYFAGLFNIRGLFGPLFHVVEADQVREPWLELFRTDVVKSNARTKKLYYRFAAFWIVVIIAVIVYVVLTPSK